LAFIYYYTKVHGVAPAEAEIQRYFEVTPPSVHQMILTLERLGLITRRASSSSFSSSIGRIGGLPGRGSPAPLARDGRAK
jgi:DNA-binding MarR family transcriptional regulator